MKNHRTLSYILFTLLCSSIPCTHLQGKLSLKKVSSFFGYEPYEQVIQEKYELTPPGKLIVENTRGNIEITTEWKKNTIFLQATKKANRQEDLEHIQINTNQTKNEITITSNITNNTIKGSIDYQLIVPANSTLVLTTDNGSITVHNVQGVTNATTTQGNITVYNTSHALCACTKKNGSITINQACGPVYAVTKHGNITIQDAKNSVVATTEKGCINTNCLELPTTSSIDLKTNYGTIALGLPSSTNATISGTTSRGTVTSDHYITIQPQTTKLNSHTWNRLKKEVVGMLGSGQASISLNSVYGNIKILDTANG
ncbi:MAG: hypothetical protein Q8Q25_00665 [bacterium]|nr:hypothetical protein [bacterium]